jgi:subtilisin family serine protease
VLLAGCATAGGGTQRPPGWEEEQRADQIMVLFEPAPEPIWTQTYYSLAKTYGLTGVAAWTMESIGAPCVVLEPPPQAETERIIEALARDHRVRLAQRVQTFETLAGPPAYNDPYHHLQHGAMAIRADAAHRWATGRGVRIAVIDTGVEIGHPELAGRIAIARSFVDRGSATFTRDLHGTSIVGVIAAVGNNAVGIVGVAPESEILALKACWPTGDPAGASRCSSYTLALAVDFALRQEIEVMNLSIGGPEDPILGALLSAAIERGVVVVAARDARSGSGSAFPASLPGVLAVAVSQDGPERRARAGALAGGLRAPGIEVLTTVPQGSYDFLSGSSLAAAHVSGVVALLLERQPGLTPADVQRILEESAPIPGESLAAGVTVDACAAVASVLGETCGDPRLATTRPSD